MGKKKKLLHNAYISHLCSQYREVTVCCSKGNVFSKNVSCFQLEPHILLRCSHPPDVISNQLGSGSDLLKITPKHLVEENQCWLTFFLGNVLLAVFAAMTPSPRSFISSFVTKAGRVLFSM